MFSKTITILAAVAMLNASLATAFQQGPPQACPAGAAAGGACTYQYQVQGDATVYTVNAFCSDSLMCAANGSSCETADNCFNYCGSDGKCGGLGSACNSNASGDETGFNCYGPTYTCSSNEADVIGNCVLTPSMSARRARSKRAATAHAGSVDSVKLRRAAEIVRRSGDEVVA